MLSVLDQIMVEIEVMLEKEEIFRQSNESIFDEKKIAPICSSLQPENCKHFHGTKKQVTSNSCKLARLTMNEKTTCVID